MTANTIKQIFTSGQYGRFYIDNDLGEIHRNKRPLTISLLPKEEKAVLLDFDRQLINFNKVVIYAPKKNPHFSDIDTHEWIYEGEWIEDFKELYESQIQKYKEYLENPPLSPKMQMLKDYTKGT